MQTIRLQVSDKVYKNLMRLLGKFKRDEIQVVTENDQFLSVQHYLQKEYKEIIDGKAKFITMDELEKDLEQIIVKHENKD